MGSSSKFWEVITEETGTFVEKIISNAFYLIPFVFAEFELFRAGTSMGMVYIGGKFGNEINVLNFEDVSKSAVQTEKKFPSNEII